MGSPGRVKVQEANHRRRRFGAGIVGFFLAVLAVAGAAVPAGAAGVCGDPGTRPWCNTSLTPAKRTELLLAAMTPDERTGMLGGDDPAAISNPNYQGKADGVPALGIPDLLLADGPFGVRVGPGTFMPSSQALGATFSPSLARRYGALLGNEARLKGIDVLYGPTLDVMRTPLAGRSFETIGEDPLLIGRLGAGVIEGIQSEGVIATAKHFAGNTQEGYGGADANAAQPGTSVVVLGGLVKEGNRMQVDAKIGERAMHEIYGAPFETAVRQAKAGAVMCAYNKVNTLFACENRDLLDGLLRKQWGFRGMVIADYLALHNPTLAVKAGLTFEAWPGNLYGLSHLNMLKGQSRVSQADIDARAAEYLETLFRFGVFDRDPYVRDDAAIDWPAHNSVAREVSAQSLTLLKNRGVLPLKADPGKVAMIGPAVSLDINGGGSSAIEMKSFESPLDSMTARLGPANVVAYTGSNPAVAASKAAQADVAVVVAGNFMTEGMDRACLSLECPLVPMLGDQDAMIEAVAKKNPNTIVVLQTGAPVTTPWRNDVAGLIAAWYPGQAVGPALTSVLFGDRDPGGRLPSTFPASETQIPLFGKPALYPGISNVLSFGDGVDVGYRSYRKRGQKPAYPFGFGLSYTSFRAGKPVRVKPHKGEFARVRVKITNTGRRTGYAVPQLYLLLAKRSKGMAPVRLAGFTKVSLGPGKSRRVSIPLTRRDLSVYSSGGWKLVNRCPRVAVGFSSARFTGETGLVGSRKCRSGRR